MAHGYRLVAPLGVRRTLVDSPWSKLGVGNRQSIAGRIDCRILSVGHTHSQFENFVKIHNITSQIY